MDPISDELQAPDGTEEDKQEYAQQTVYNNNQHSSLDDTYNVASAAHKKIQSERELVQLQESLMPKITKANRRRRATTTFEVVHGSRVIRSNSRKDRHSKVCTTRGPKDRRVRLSPTTAIQFYDVQDRLGYDRPSKAIDWLMQEAKTAIDALNDSSQAAFATYRQQHLSTAAKNLNQMEQGIINDHNPISSFGVSVNGDSASVPITDDFNSSRLLYQEEHEFLSALTSTSQILDASLDMATSQRIFTWNCGSTNSDNSSLPLQYPLSHGQMYFTQREPLQSSFNIINSAESPRLNFYSDELSNFTLDESEKNAVPVTSNTSAAYFLHMDE